MSYCQQCSDHLAELQRLQLKLDEALAFERTVLAREEGQIAEVQRLREQVSELSQFHSAAQLGAESFLAETGYSDSNPYPAPAIARLMQDYATLENERLREQVRVLREALTQIRQLAELGSPAACEGIILRTIDTLVATEPRP